jgi:hypothetical protein
MVMRNVIPLQNSEATRNKNLILPSLRRKVYKAKYRLKLKRSRL